MSRRNIITRSLAVLASALAACRRPPVASKPSDDPWSGWYCSRCNQSRAAHTTWYAEGRGTFCLCEMCWSALKPTDRLPYYRQLWGKYNVPESYSNWNGSRRTTFEMKDAECKRTYESWALIEKSVMLGA